MKKFLLALFAVASMATCANAQQYTAVEPAAGSVLAPGTTSYVDMKFVFTFDEAVKASVSSVTLKGADNSTVDPDDAWYANLSSDGKTATVWGADYDGFVCQFKPTDQAYYFNVPAGAFKTATGAANEAFTLTYYGKTAPAPTAINDVNKSNATVVARFNLQGQSVNENAQGVQIVKMSDGSTMKVVVY